MKIPKEKLKGLIQIPDDAWMEKKKREATKAQ